MGTSTSRVTAVITAYNAERYVGRAIESALTQSLGPVHVIVVDDGSSDGTSQVVASYGDKVELIRLPQNSGPAVGRTTGLMKCTTEFVAFLDSDDYWLPEFVQETVSFLDAHPEAIAVNAGYCKKDWDGRDYIKPVLDETDADYYGAKGAVCPDFYGFWSEYRAVLTGTVMMRTAIASQTDGQRADLRLTQDLEFWGYLATFGRWGFVPKPLLVTDQKALTPKERLAKFKRRYTFFRNLEVEEWARRIRPRLKDSSGEVGFERFLGHIATTIALANAYTFQLSKSYRLAKQWRYQLDSGLGSVLKYGTYGGPVFWPLICLTLRFREVVKAYWRPLFKRPAPETSTDG
ncbi:MAG TPA: glycosyltransferase family 2 protein [Sedimentisphaerales bacterium]|nr:glycosyltransferase family 2 protein [Sedimentisphaerales bacterium]